MDAKRAAELIDDALTEQHRGIAMLFAASIEPECYERVMIRLRQMLDALETLQRPLAAELLQSALSLLEEYVAAATAKRGS